MPAKYSYELYNNNNNVDINSYEDFFTLNINLGMCINNYKLLENSYYKMVNDKSLLMYVVINSNKIHDHINIISYLLKTNTIINQQNSEGWTALMFASKFSNSTSNINVVKFLIESGANINIRNKLGLTAFMITCREINTTSSFNLVKLFLTFNIDINQCDKQGNTALIHTVIRSNNELSYNTVQLLIINKANINIQNNNGCTALMYACRYSNSTSSIDTVKLLLDNNAKTELREKDGWTSLMLAARYSNNGSSEDTIKLLLDYNTDINAIDKSGNTALILATKHSLNDSSIKTVTHLLFKGANPNIQNLKGYTALMYAINYYKKESDPICIPLLLRNNADPNLLSYNNGNKSALHIMIEKNSNYIYDLNDLKLLLLNGSNINQKDENGNTPIMLAGKLSLKSYILVLITNRANLCEKNNQGETFFTYYNSNNMIKILINTYINSLIKNNIYINDNIYDFMIENKIKTNDKLINTKISLLFLYKNHIIFDIDNDNKECSICFDHNNNLKAICDHVFCINCFDKLKKCPVCYENILGDKFSIFYDKL